MPAAQAARKKDTQPKHTTATQVQQQLNSKYQKTYSFGETEENNEFVSVPCVDWKRSVVFCEQARKLLEVVAIPADASKTLNIAPTTSHPQSVDATVQKSIWCVNGTSSNNTQNNPTALAAVPGDATHSAGAPQGTTARQRTQQQTTFLHVTRQRLSRSQLKPSHKGAHLLWMRRKVLPRLWTSMCPLLCNPLPNMAMLLRPGHTG